MSSSPPKRHPAKAPASAVGAPRKGAAEAAAKPVAPVPKPSATASPPPPPPKGGPAGQRRRALRLPPAGRRIGSVPLFWTACAISGLLHLGLLIVPIVAPHLKSSPFRDRGLEVVLVNAKHAHAPRDPQVLAQANLDGGGNTAQKVTPSTPLPPQEQTREGDTLLEAKRRVEQLEAQQRQLLTQSKTLRAARVDVAKPEESTEKPQQSGLELADSARAMARQQAVVDKALREYAERPRKMFVSPRAAEYRFAQYVEDWRQKVERIGTLNFPKDRNGNRLYGSVGVYIEIYQDGSLYIAPEVRQSSGNPDLDHAALRIVQLASPFAPFPAEIRKDAQVLQIYRRWNFEKGDTVTTVGREQ